MKRTSNKIANTQPNLQTNSPKTVKKQDHEQTSVSELMLNSDFAQLEIVTPILGSQRKGFALFLLCQQRFQFTASQRT